MDFDLEEPEIENSSAIASELGAAQIPQQNNPGARAERSRSGTGFGVGLTEGKGVVTIG